MNGIEFIDIYIYIGASEQGGRGVSDPLIPKYGGGG